MKILTFLVSAAVATISLSAGAATTYSLNSTAVGQFGSGPYGSVTLTQSFNDVLVSVSLRSDLNFVDTGSHAPFTFNVVNASLTDIRAITFLSGLGDVFVVNDSAKNAPFGEFQFGIVCKSVPGNACTSGGSGGGYLDPLSFTVKNALESDFAYKSSDGNPKAYFAADVIGANGITGTVGSTAQGVVSAVTPQRVLSPVPEPETYAMLLAGLGLMGTIARRRNKDKAA